MSSNSVVDALNRFNPNAREKEFLYVDKENQIQVWKPSENGGRFARFVFWMKGDGNFDRKSVAATIDTLIETGLKNIKREDCGALMGKVGALQNRFLKGENSIFSFLVDRSASSTLNRTWTRLHNVQNPEAFASVKAAQERASAPEPVEEIPGFAKVDTLVGSLIAPLPVAPPQKTNSQLLEERFALKLAEWQSDEAYGPSFTLNIVGKDLKQHLPSLDSGETTIAEIEASWDETAGKVQAHRRQFEGIFTPELKGFVGLASYTLMKNEFETKILPQLLGQNDQEASDAITQQVENGLLKLIPNLFQKTLKEFKGKYGENLELKNISENLPGYVSRLMNGEKPEAILAEWENGAQQECFQKIVEEKQNEYKAKYGDINLECKFDDYKDSFGEGFKLDVFKERVSTDLNDKALKLANEEKMVITERLLSKYKKDYSDVSFGNDESLEIVHVHKGKGKAKGPILESGAQRKVTPQRYEQLLPIAGPKIENIQEFEKALDEDLKKYTIGRYAELLKMDPKSLEEDVKKVQNQYILASLKPDIKSFMSTVELKSLESIDIGGIIQNASSLESAKVICREKLIEAATAQFTEEYGFPIAIDPNTKDVKSYKEIGETLNVRIYDSISTNHMPLIDEELGVRMSNTQTAADREEIFNLAVELMAKKSNLDSEKVKSGEVRLTGYSEKLMNSYISIAMIEKHGSFIEKAKLKAETLFS